MTILDSMVYRLVGDATSYLSMLMQAQQATKTTASVIEQEGQKVEAFKNQILGWGQSIVGVLGQVGLSFGLLSVATKGVQLSAEAEQMQISFETMLKDADKGRQVLKDLKKYASDTPFEFPEIQQAAKTLLQFNISAKDLLPTIKMLGDVSGGNAQKFMSLSLAYGQMSSTGRLMGGELNQMINGGFNPLMEISRTSGKSMEFLRREMDQGRITIGMVEKSFKTATAEGGQFFGLLEKQSKSLTGLYSTMRDAINEFMTEIGNDIVSSLDLKTVTKTVTEYVGQLKSAWATLGPTIKSTLVIVVALLPVLSGIALSIIPIITAVGALSGSFSAGLTIIMGYLTAAKLLSVTLVGMKAAMMGGIVYGVIQLGLYINEVITATDRLTLALQKLKMESLQAKVLDREKVKTQAVMAEVEKFANPAGKKTYLDEEIAKAEALLADKQNAIKNQERAVGREREGIVGGLGTIFGSATADLEIAKLKELTDVEAILTERIKALNKAREEFGDIKAEKKMAEDIKTAADRLKEEILTLNMSKEALERRKFALQGASDQQLKDYDKYVAFTTIIKRQVEVEKILQDQRMGFKKATQGTGKETDDLEFKLKELKATQDQIDEAKKLASQTKLLNEVKKQVEDNVSPLEKRAKKQEELNQAYKDGIITLREYVVAMDQTRGQLNASGTFHQSEFGSAEGGSRIDAYARMADEPRVRLLNASAGIAPGQDLNGKTLVEIRNILAKKSKEVALKPANINTGGS